LAFFSPVTRQARFPFFFSLGTLSRHTPSFPPSSRLILRKPAPDALIIELALPPCLFGFIVLYPPSFFPILRQSFLPFYSVRDNIFHPRRITLPEIFPLQSQVFLRNPGEHFSSKRFISFSSPPPLAVLPGFPFHQNSAVFASFFEDGSRPSPQFFPDISDLRSPRRAEEIFSPFWVPVAFFPFSPPLSPRPTCSIERPPFPSRSRFFFFRYGHV